MKNFWNDIPFEIAQLLMKNDIKIIYFTIYLFVNQYIMSVAFWLRFGCVLPFFGATVADFSKSQKNGATETPGCGQSATNQNTDYQSFKGLKYARLRGCAKKIPPPLSAESFFFSSFKLY